MIRKTSIREGASSSPEGWRVGGVDSTSPNSPLTGRADAESHWA